MGHSKSPKVQKAAPAPEPVHRTTEEAAQVRSNARQKAASAFGSLGTDVTRGALEASAATGEKKNKLGAKTN